MVSSIDHIKTEAAPQQLVHVTTIPLLPHKVCILCSSDQVTNLKQKWYLVTKQPSKNYNLSNWEEMIEKSWVWSKGPQQTWGLSLWLPIWSHNLASRVEYHSESHHSQKMTVRWVLVGLDGCLQSTYTQWAKPQFFLLCPSFHKNVRLSPLLFFP